MLDYDWRDDVERLRDEMEHISSQLEQWHDHDGGVERRALASALERFPLQFVNRLACVPHGLGGARGTTLGDAADAFAKALAGMVSTLKGGNVDASEFGPRFARYFMDCSGLFLAEQQCQSFDEFLSDAKAVVELSSVKSKRSKTGVKGGKASAEARKGPGERVEKAWRGSSEPERSRCKLIATMLGMEVDSVAYHVRKRKLRKN